MAVTIIRKSNLGALKADLGMELGIIPVYKQLPYRAVQRCAKATMDLDKRCAILCVDDESIILNSLLRQLQNTFDDAYLYETAENAEEAMELIAELSEEHTELLVIVSDWLMPGPKGDEFLIRVHEKFPGVVKIMLTGQADSTAIQRAEEEANLHACLQKPWNEAELMNCIQSAIANS